MTSIVAMQQRIGPSQWSIFLGLAAMVLGGCQSEVAIPLKSQFFSTDMLIALTYPRFLEDVPTAERYRQQGLAYRRSGSLERSIATFKIAAALDPHNPNSHIILGWTQHLAGHHGDAANTLHRALQQDPNQVQALNALGIVYLVDGQWDAAVATHQRAIALKPDNEIAHYNLSLAYERLGQFDQAINHAQTATELEPSNPHPWVALALAHHAQGDPTATQSAYQQALRLDDRYRNRPYLDHLAQAGFNPDQIDTVATIQTLTAPQ